MPTSSLRLPKRREVDHRDLDEPQRSEKKPSRQIRRRIGVVVGIGAYLDYKILQNPTRDAEAVAEVLEQDYGFSPTLLLDGEATRDAIEQAIRTSLAGADDSTQWIFYFAGHGKREEGKGYLLPVDARGKNLATCLPLSTLLEVCHRSRCGEILIILDVCYSGQALVRPEELSDALDPDPDQSRRGDPGSIEVLGYLGLQSEAAVAAMAR